MLLQNYESVSGDTTGCSYVKYITHKLLPDSLSLFPQIANMKYLHQKMNK